MARFSKNGDKLGYVVGAGTSHNTHTLHFLLFWFQGHSNRNKNSWGPKRANDVFVLNFPTLQTKIYQVTFEKILKQKVCECVKKCKLGREVCLSIFLRRNVGNLPSSCPKEFSNRAKEMASLSHSLQTYPRLARRWHGHHIHHIRAWCVCVCLWDF